MDAHLLRLLAPALENSLSGARVEKIQEFGPGHLGITFYNGTGKRSLYVRFDRQQPFCFISSRRINGVAKPSAQIMRFRKYFCGRKIVSIVVQVWSRKIWLLASGAQAEKNVWLCLNLARAPELHFLDTAESPESEAANWPDAGELLGSLQEWQNWPVLTPALRKTLLRLDKPEQAALLADLADGGGDVFLYLGNEGKIQQISAWPLKTSLEEESREPSLAVFEKAGFDLVLDVLARQQAREKRAPGEKRRKKISQTLEKIRQDEKRLVRMEARASDALLIQANLWRFPADYHAGIIELVDDAGIRKIILNKRFGLLENMQRMFHEAARGKRGLARLQERRVALEKELADLNEGATFAFREASAKICKPVDLCLPPHCSGFISSDGYQILRGKDARGNQLIRKLASPHDLWAHVEQGTGAHVIIRRPHAGDEVPERTLLEAGTLAANKSWLAGAGSGNVMYAELRHVKPVRKGPQGKVLIDRIRETRLVAIDQEMEEKLRMRSGE